MSHVSDPAMLVVRPLSHAIQAVRVGFDRDPRAQAVQALLPSVLLYVPGAHAWHNPLPSRVYPASQIHVAVNVLSSAYSHVNSTPAVFVSFVLLTVQPVNIAFAFVIVLLSGVAGVKPAS